MDRHALSPEDDIGDDEGHEKNNARGHNHRNEIIPPLSFHLRPPFPTSRRVVVPIITHSYEFVKFVLGSTALFRIAGHGRHGTFVFANTPGAGWA